MDQTGNTSSSQERVIQAIDNLDLDMDSIPYEGVEDTDMKIIHDNTFAFETLSEETEDVISRSTVRDDEDGQTPDELCDSEIIPVQKTRESGTDRFRSIGRKIQLINRFAPKSAVNDSEDHTLVAPTMESMADGSYDQKIGYISTMCQSLEERLKFVSRQFAVMPLCYAFHPYKNKIKRIFFSK